MARSAADATRFTQAGPYASSKASAIAFSSPAPPNETPQQKVARLREAARRFKGGQESTWDRIVTRGRGVADVAHRFTALSLIGLTVLASGVTIIAVGDLIFHNRRQKKLFYAEMEAKRTADLEAARQAMEQGTVSTDQMLLINQERAKAEAQEEQKARGGIFKRTGTWLMSGFSKEDIKGGKIMAGAKDLKSSKGGVAAAAGDPELLGHDAVMANAAVTQSDNSSNGLGIVKAVGEKVEHERRRGEKAFEASYYKGKPMGPLDLLGAEAGEAVEKQTKSLKSWLTRW